MSVSGHDFICTLHKLLGIYNIHTCYLWCHLILAAALGICGLCCKDYLLRLTLSITYYVNMSVSGHDFMHS